MINSGASYFFHGVKKNYEIHHLSWKKLFSTRTLYLWHITQMLKDACQVLIRVINFNGIAHKNDH